MVEFAVSTKADAAVVSPVLASPVQASLPIEVAVPATQCII